MAHQNQGIYSGVISAKETAQKDGRVFAHKFKVAQMGETMEFDVGEKRYGQFEEGEEVVVSYRLKAAGYKIYVNVVSVHVPKAEPKKQSA